VFSVTLAPGRLAQVEQEGRRAHEGVVEEQVAPLGQLRGHQRLAVLAHQQRAMPGERLAARRLRRRLADGLGQRRGVRRAGARAGGRASDQESSTIHVAVSCRFVTSSIRESGS